MSFFQNTQVKSETAPSSTLTLNLTSNAATPLKQEATNTASQAQNQANNTTSTGTLPNILSFSVPSLTPLKATEAAEKKNPTLLLGGQTASGATTDSTKNLALNPGSTIYSSLRPQSVKDQNLPAPLMECVESFK